uniref:Uncharacterized protein n=1 Tax=Esox lucius TaxID=8010 RepID=A0A3P8XV90_ESOLU
YYDNTLVVVNQRSPFVLVLNGYVAAQNLDKDLTKLEGGEVVQEGVEHRTEVEEGVRYRLQCHIAAEVGQGPAGLWHCGSHQATHLVGQPKQCSGRPWHLNDAQLTLRGLKCAKKTSPTQLHHHHQPAQW